MDKWRQLKIPTLENRTKGQLNRFMREDLIRHLGFSMHGAKTCGPRVLSLGRTGALTVEVHEVHLMAEDAECLQ